MDVSLLLQQGLNGVVLTAEYALFALGLSVVWGVLKVMNLAHAELFTVGALVVSALAASWGMPWWQALVVAAALSGVLAVVVDTVAFWPLRRQNLDVEDFEMATLITSLGAGAIMVAIMTRLTDHSPQSVSADVFTFHATTIGGLRVSNIQVIIVVTSLALVLSVAWLINRTQFGRALRALAFSTAMARVMGVRSEATYRTTLFMCGALAGIGGALYTLFIGQADSFTGGTLLLKGIAIILLAGAGSVAGLIVGAALLGFSETLGSLFLPTMVQSATPFLLLLLVLLIKPNGLFGKSTAVRV